METRPEQPEQPEQANTKEKTNIATRERIVDQNNTINESVANAEQRLGIIVPSELKMSWVENVCVSGGALGSDLLWEKHALLNDHKVLHIYSSKGNPLNR